MIDYHYAAGNYIYDRKGKKYLDLTAGECIAPLGWQPIDIVQAVKNTFDQRSFSIMAYNHTAGNLLRETIMEVYQYPGYIIFPALSGSEAVDLALRISFRNTSKLGVLTAKGAYHGNTAGAIGLCSIPGWRHETEHACFKSHALNIPFREADVDVSLKEVEFYFQNSEIACVILEPIQGNAGYRVPHPVFMQGLHKLCKVYGVIFVVDEITVGLGRTGKFKAVDYFGIQPDILIAGKGLGAGVMPIAFAFVNSELADMAKGPGFCSSLAWTAPACTAAQLTLSTLQENEISQRSIELRLLIDSVLNEIKTLSKVNNITGKGMGIGIELDERDAKEKLRVRAWKQLLNTGVITVPNPNLPGLVLTPPLTISDKELMAGMETILTVLSAL